MRAEDLPEVAAIADEVHLNIDEPPETYRNRLSIYPAGCRVYQTGGAVRGYLISHPWVAGKPPMLGQIVSTLPTVCDCYYLHDIALLPSVRAGGVGKEALRYCVEIAQSEGFDAIELVAVNGADTYWATLGFVCIPYQVGQEYGAGSALMRLRVEPSI